MLTKEIVLMVSKPMMTIEDFAEQVCFRIERESIVTASIGFAEWVPGVTVDKKPVTTNFAGDGNNRAIDEYSDFTGTEADVHIWFWCKNEIVW